MGPTLLFEFEFNLQPAPPPLKPPRSDPHQETQGRPRRGGGCRGVGGGRGSLCRLCEAQGTGVNKCDLSCHQSCRQFMRWPVMSHVSVLAKT